MVYEGGKAIGESTLTQLTIGFRLGGQVYSEIIFFEAKASLMYEASAGGQKFAFAPKK